MADLTNQEIHALGRSVGLDIQEPELTQVGYSLNAILEAMEGIEVPGYTWWNRCRSSSIRRRCRMNPSDIPYLPATELGGLIRAKEVTPLEAVEAYLARIEEVDTRLNSYITVCGDEAREEAKSIGEEIARGESRGPLHGVPVGIKDQIYVKGVRNSDGSKIRNDFIPDFDATVVTNLRRAGAVILGKLNMSEFAMGDPISSYFGAAHNPWDLERNPGTSSTGSGAATAGFLCATSLGEDTGGSIRGPAANCGLVGIRPTWGRVSRYGVDGACWSIDTIGPISRTVSDCAATIGAIAGYDPNDPYTGRVPVPDYLASALTGDIRGLRVGLVTELMDARPRIGPARRREAVTAAAQVFAELGRGCAGTFHIPLARSRPGSLSGPSPTPSGSACARSGCASVPRTTMSTLA